MNAAFPAPLPRSRASGRAARAPPFRLRGGFRVPGKRNERKDIQREHVSSTEPGTTSQLDRGPRKSRFPLQGTPENVPPA